MSGNLELLALVQGQIINCRQAASEEPNAAVALLLFRIAEEVEAEAREADTGLVASRIIHPRLGLMAV
jgi:hypothetical protein